MGLRIAFIMMPFCVLTGGIIHRGHHTGFTILILMVISSLVKEKALKYLCYYATFWAMFVMIAKVTGHLHKSYAVTANGRTVFIALGMIVYVVVAHSKESKHIFFNLICVAAMLQSIIGVMQLLGYDPFFSFLSCFVGTRYELPAGWPVGSLGNNNFFAGYLAISLPFFFRKRILVCAGFIPLIIFLIINSNTSGAVIAVCIGMGIFFKKTRWLAILFIVGVLYALFFDNNGDTGTMVIYGRFWIWKKALSSIFSHPIMMLIGHGPQAKTGFAFPYHNEYLQLWFNYGAVSVCLWAYYLIGIKNTDRNLYAGFIIASAFAFTSYPMHLAPSAFLIFIIMGLLEREKYHGGLSDICGNLRSG